MFFRSPIVRFFNRILNRVTITVVLVALQLLWLCWVFYSCLLYTSPSPRDS